jgi:hypothetical protein
MRKATLLALAAAALLCVPAGALAQFEGVLDYSMKGDADGKPMKADWRMYVASGGWRSEMQIDTSQFMGKDEKPPAGMMPGMMKITMLGKLSDKGVSYMVNDEKKVYSKITPDDTPDDPSEKWTAKKEGKNTIAGFSCQMVLMTDADGDRIDACFTTAIMASRDWMAAMRAQSKRNQWLNALRDAGVDGFPILMAFVPKGHPRPNMVMELTKATKQPVPASMFSVPAGYKEVGLMGVMMSPEQEQAISGQMKAMQEELSKLPPEQRKQIEEMMKKYGAPTPPPNKN